MLLAGTRSDYQALASRWTHKASVSLAGKLICMSRSIWKVSAAENFDLYDHHKLQVWTNGLQCARERAK